MLVPKESHHIGCSLDLVEILTYLYFKELNINPKKPNDPNRDIFILSKGHAGAALYSVLAHRGFFDKKLLMKYDTNGGLLPEHSTSVVPGIEVSTGSLGHGLSIGVGYALSAKNDSRKNKVFAILSDGELNEGSTWEAIMFAAQHKLDNLVAIVDKNGYQGYGNTKDIIDLSPLSKKFETFGWTTSEVNGHDFKDLEDKFKKINFNDNKPHCIFAKTIKGKGIPEFEGKFESHYHSITESMKKDLLNKLEVKT